MDETPEPLAQDLIYAGLRALRAAAPLELCAYLHVSPGQGPQLFLGTPDLASIEPNDAFALFSALRDALDGAGGADLAVSGYAALALPSEGPASRGLHVLGRRGAAPQGEEREALLDLARIFAALGHDLEAMTRAQARQERAAEPSRVSVEMGDGSVRAEVSITIGEEIRGGTAEATSAARAVALATLDAVDASLKLVEVTEGPIGGQRAVLALLSDERERLGLGAAIVDDTADLLQSTAIACLRAARDVRAGLNSADPLR